MIGKLIKYEYRATARIFWPLAGAAAGLSAVTWITMQLGSARLAEVMGIFHKVFGLAEGVLTIFTFAALMALMIGTLLVTIQRFYKNILGDEGYLMLTLPATPAQHIAAKLIVGTAWTAASLVIALLAALALGLSAVEITSMSGDGPTVAHLTFAQAAVGFESEMGIELWRFVGVLGLLFLCGVVNTYLLAYLCMAVGSQWPQQRLAASIGIFAALDFVRRILWVCVALVSGATFANSLYQKLIQMNAGTAFLTFGAGACGILTLEAVVYFFAARHVLTKRLNLA